MEQSDKNVGPYTVKYGAVTFTDVTEVSWDYSANTNEQTLIDGRTLTLPTTTTASVSVTLYGADIKTLSLIFPQFAVTSGSQLSTGETLTKDAFDAKPMTACGAGETKDDLEIIGCKLTTRLVNARAIIDSIEYQDNITQNVTIRFIGEPDPGEAVFQIYPNGGIQTD